MARMPIRPTTIVQNYSWGKVGKDSLVARLLSETQERPFAELWLKAEELSLLFKVLSVGDALSIQVHPDAKQAQLLEQRDPNNYPKAAAKPEASVAITRVELLYGFRPAKEIRQMLQAHPELASLLPTKLQDTVVSDSLSDNELISAVFNSVMRANKNDLRIQIPKLAERLNASKNPISPEQKWILKLCDKYPDDPGIFCFLLLNYLQLEPSESIFIQPGIVHAYLSGDMIEIMNLSDTVVRAGLTPKFIDVETLLEIAQINEQSVTLSQPKTNSLGVDEYSYPCKDFGICFVNSPLNYTEQIHEPEIWLCLEGTSGILTIAGEKFPLSSGTAFFMPPNLGLCEVNLEAGQIARARKGI